MIKFVPSAQVQDFKLFYLSRFFFTCHWRQSSTVLGKQIDTIEIDTIVGERLTHVI